MLVIVENSKWQFEIEGDDDGKTLDKILNWIHSYLGERKIRIVP